MFFRDKKVMSFIFLLVNKEYCTSEAKLLRNYRKFIKMRERERKGDGDGVGITCSRGLRPPRNLNEPCLISS